MTAQTDLLNARLVAAEQAYHDLIMGNKATVIVDQNGERVEFNATTTAKLAAYIATLKQQLALVPAGCNGPMRVWM